MKKIKKSSGKEMTARYNNHMQFRTLPTLLVLCLIAPLVSGYLYDEPQEEDTGIKKKGVIHNIAEDRLVARVKGGVYEPEGLDIYLKRHLDQMHTRLNAMEKNMTDIQKQIQEILTHVTPEPEVVDEEPEPEPGVVVL